MFGTTGIPTVVMYVSGPQLPRCVRTFTWCWSHPTIAVPPLIAAKGSVHLPSSIIAGEPDSPVFTFRRRAQSSDCQVAVVVTSQATTASPSASTATLGLSTLTEGDAE